MKNLFLSIALFCCTLGCSHAGADSIHTTQATSLRDDIAEMLLVGFRGTSLTQHNHIYRDIVDYHIGGVILFEYDAPTGTRKRNVASPKQLKNLCQELQDLRPETLFIGIDQEGGYVARLRPSYGFPKIASAKTSAERDSVLYYATLTAKILHSYGINLNFAPCADVDVNPNCPVIGKIERSFSPDAQVVTEHVRTWLTAQQQQGVIGCMKHFPGHGSAKGDTHHGLVVLEDWTAEELLPYQQMIAEGKVQMIMTAHVINKKVDPTLPASLSIAHGKMLREEYHYNGVIITDDIAMGAIANEYSYADAIRMALQAGADILCISNNGTGRDAYDTEIVPKTIEIIEELVRQGLLTKEQIHTSAERIRTLKQQTAQHK